MRVLIGTYQWRASAVEEVEVVEGVEVYFQSTVIKIIMYSSIAWDLNPRLLNFDAFFNPLNPFNALSYFNFLPFQVYVVTIPKVAAMIV
jgi:hypothetical protein